MISSEQGLTDYRIVSKIIIGKNNVENTATSYRVGKSLF